MSSGFDDFLGIADTWRLCDELTVHQAALLHIGIDPASEAGSKCEDWAPHERPDGYEGAVQAFSAALRKGAISGTNVEVAVGYWDGEPTGYRENTTAIHSSTVERESLVNWLRSRGINTGFFFPEKSSTPDYLNPSNPRFAPKLAASINAWLAVTDPGAKSPKQALDKWLRENAAKFGLTDDEGNPINTAIEECSKVANWQPGGGAAKTPGG